MKTICQNWWTKLTFLGLFRAALLLATAAGLAGCASTKTGGGGQPLRVGIAPTYRPLVFEENNTITGAEIDLAYALAKQLGRPVEFVTLRFDELIPALTDQRIDIIMSGMSVTRYRQVQVAFSQPYLQNQLRAIYTRANAGAFITPADVLNTSGKIGVIAGTTADIFVQKNCPNATRVAVSSRNDVGFYLMQGRSVDLFIDDSFALIQILSGHEAELTFMREPLSQEDLAWGMRPMDKDLLSQVNAVLERWKADGTLDSILLRWMPYLKEYRQRTQASAATARTHDGIVM